MRIKKKLRQLLEFSEDIINTVREPLIALDQDLRVVSASHSFYQAFQVKQMETVGQLIYDLGNNQWGIQRLRELLEKTQPEQTSFDNYEVEHNFAAIGQANHALECLNRPGFVGDSKLREDGVMNTNKRYSPEVRERAIRLVLEQCRGSW